MAKTASIVAARNNSHAMKHRQPALAVAVSLLLLLLSAGCQRRETYMHYEPLDSQSWDVTDRTVYDVPPLEATGNYRMRLHVRTTTAPRYPFKVLYVEVRQQWRAELRIDTIACRFSDIGPNATGISIRQHAFPIGNYHLQQGDSACITLRHVMRREELPGISDLGISLEPMK